MNSNGRRASPVGVGGITVSFRPPISRRVAPHQSPLPVAGLANLRSSTIPAQSMPVNLSSFFCLTHGVQSTSAVRCFRCFCCFGGKITAGDASFLAEILGYRRFGERKGSLFVRCFPLFLCEISKTERAALPPKISYPCRSIKSACMQQYHESIILSI
jgi:hypothetical protein